MRKGRYFRNILIIVFHGYFGTVGFILKKFCLGDHGLDPSLFNKLQADGFETSARNIEILLWRLRNNRQTNGQPYLITSERDGVIDNLSFERLFGKLIALQDMMARIARDADNRRVTRAVHTATSVFIPLPI